MAVNIAHCQFHSVRMTLNFLITEIPTDNEPLSFVQLPGVSTLRYISVSAKGHQKVRVHTGEVGRPHCSPVCDFALFQGFLANVSVDFFLEEELLALSVPLTDDCLHVIARADVESQFLRLQAAHFRVDDKSDNDTLVLISLVLSIDGPNLDPLVIHKDRVELGRVLLWLLWLVERKFLAEV